MSKRPDDNQIGAYQAIHELCKQTARAVWLMARAEGRKMSEREEEPTRADVLLEWYDAVTEMRDELESSWPGVSKFAYGPNHMLR